MRIFIFAACMAATLLSGCQSVRVKLATETTVAPSRSESPRVAQQLQQLWMEGDLNVSTPLPVTTVRADSDRVSFSWNGDAVELLRALARARGQMFIYVGVRLPLPVDIEVQNVTYANVLRIIEMQIAWRATLVTYPGQMVLQYTPTLSAGQTRYVKGGSR